MSSETGTLKTTLLVDDNPNDLFVAEQLLRAAGYEGEIRPFDSPRQALAWLQRLGDNGRQYPHHILLDIKMPVINGFEFLQKAEALPGFAASGCSVTLASAYLDYHEGDEIRQRAKNTPRVRRLIEKPFSVEKMAELT